MAKISKRDFVEIEYTGKTKEDNIVFDTTDEKLAKENDVFSENNVYAPVVICIGEQQIIKGLDAELENKEEGKSYTITLSADNAFGRKNAKMIQLINTTKFLQQNIQPMPGLQVNIDGLFGVIKTVSGGRTLVDFNHPLAGKEIVYDVKINKIITDEKEKLKAFLKLSLGLAELKEEDIKIGQNEATIAIKEEIPAELKTKLKEEIARLIPSIKNISFIKIKDVTPKKELKK